MGRAAAAILMFLAAAGGCGGDGNDVAAQNQRMESELMLEVETLDDARPAPEVACVRPRPERFFCTVYRVRAGKPVADAAFYNVLDCYGGQWRAVARRDSSDEFPTYVPRHTASDGIKARCVELDRRYGVR